MSLITRNVIIGSATVCCVTLGLVTPSYAGTSSNTARSSSSVSSRRIIPLSNKQILPDGATQYTYYIGGMKNTFLVPPPSFDPNTANNQDLMKYGYPPRPDKTSLSLANYQNSMKDWASFVRNHKAPTSYPKNIIVQENTSNGGSSTASATTSTDLQNTSNATSTNTWSPNWSGYDAVSTYNEWTMVSGEFYQPSWTYNSSYPNAQESTWAGIGGINGSSDLIQDGTAIGTGGQMVAWYEYLNSSYDSHQIDFPSVVVHPGDHIKAYVSYDSATGETLFDVIDYTDNTSGAAQLYGSAPYYDGRYAEFVCERPTVNNAYTPLANFGSVDFFQAQVYSTYGYWNQVGALNNQHIEMTSNGLSTGTPLANASSLTSSNTFWDYYHNAE